MQSVKILFRPKSVYRSWKKTHYCTFTISSGARLANQKTHRQFIHSSLVYTTHFKAAVSIHLTVNRGFCLYLCCLLPFWITTWEKQKIYVFTCICLLNIYFWAKPFFRDSSDIFILEFVSEINSTLEEKKVSCLLHYVWHTNLNDWPFNFINCRKEWMPFYWDEWSKR